MLGAPKQRKNKSFVKQMMRKEPGPRGVRNTQGILRREEKLV